MALENLYRISDWLRHRLRLGRWNEAQAWGRRGEDIAHRYLKAKGYRIVARNYRLPAGDGELDLVAWDGPVLVFVEVKSRRVSDYGAPDRAIGPDKRRNLLRTAVHYALDRKRALEPNPPFRFDIVNVVWGKSTQVEHIVDAFSATRRLGTGRDPHERRSSAGEPNAGEGAGLTPALGRGSR